MRPTISGSRDLRRARVFSLSDFPTRFHDLASALKPQVPRADSSPGLRKSPTPLPVLGSPLRDFAGLRERFTLLAIPTGGLCRSRSQIDQKYSVPTRARSRCSNCSRAARGRGLTMPYAIIVDDDQGIQDAIKAVAEQEGFAVTSLGSLADARQFLAEQVPDVALIDLKLPDGSGADLVPEIAANAPGTEIVLITGHATVDSVVDAFREGVSDYLTKPVEIKRLQLVLGKRGAPLRAARSGRQPARRAARPRPLRRADRRVAGDAGGLRPDRRVAPEQTRRSSSQGESGTGKELVAQTVHELSRRRKQPFVALNCGAITAAAHRERALRPRARQLHRRGAIAPRLLRARRGRHAVPRRDHRDAARAPGQAAARSRDRS